MNRKLLYNGKELYQMSMNELKKQLELNIQRIKIRNIFLWCIVIVCIFINPVLSIVPIIMSIVTSYWLFQNNEKIKMELNKR